MNSNRSTSFRTSTGRKLPVLTGLNYPRWSRQLSNLLEANGLWDVTSGKHRKPIAPPPPPPPVLPKHIHPDDVRARRARRWAMEMYRVAFRNHDEDLGNFVERWECWKRLDRKAMAVIRGAVSAEIGEWLEGEGVETACEAWRRLWELWGGEERRRVEEWCWEVMKAHKGCGNS